MTQLRGTTSRQIIDMAREAGAKKVYMASAHHQLNTQMFMVLTCQRAKNLLQTIELDDIARFIGCDKLFYQDLDDLIDSVKSRTYNHRL